MAWPQALLCALLGPGPHTRCYAPSSPHPPSHVPPTRLLQNMLWLVAGTCPPGRHGVFVTLVRPVVPAPPKRLNAFQKARPSIVRYALLAIFGFIGIWVIVVLTTLALRRRREKAMVVPRLSSTVTDGSELQRVAPAPASAPAPAPAPAPTPAPAPAPTSPPPQLTDAPRLIVVTPRHRPKG
jgi:hypothetical protein